MSEAISRNGVGRAWVAYAATGLVLSAGLGGLVSLLLTGAAEEAMWLSAAIAYGLQLVVFAAILYGRRDPTLFLLSWLGGMLLRFGAVGGVAWWLARSAVLPIEAALLSLVGFVFLLLLLEPVFLRGVRRS